VDYFTHLPATADLDRIRDIHTTKQAWVNQNKKGFLRYRTPFQSLSSLKAERVDCTGDTVTIGHRDEIPAETRHQLIHSLHQFMPWRKGPFSVFGVEIDAEWRSERKWNRLSPFLPDLADKVICDVGCNNGYYMFRMHPRSPRLVIGLEPSVQHYYCFKALNAMAGLTNLHIDLLGVEHLHHFAETFDVIFLMGIIYHRPSPVDVLRDLFGALTPGGTLILESQAIPGNKPVALFPEKTYAKVPGTYFVPTGPCLINWMKRAGFSGVELFCNHPMNQTEQRATEWMIFESYQDFIDPDDSSRTVEGYPAPVRVFLKGSKK